MPGIVVETWVTGLVVLRGIDALRAALRTDFEANSGPTQVAIHVGI